MKTSTKEQTKIIPKETHPDNLLGIFMIVKYPKTAAKTCAD